MFWIAQEHEITCRLQFKLSWHLPCRFFPWHVSNRNASTRLFILVILAQLRKPKTTYLRAFCQSFSPMASTVPDDGAEKCYYWSDCKTLTTKRFRCGLDHRVWMCGNCHKKTSHSLPRWSCRRPLQSGRKGLQNRHRAWQPSRFFSFDGRITFSRGSWQLSQFFSFDARITFSRGVWR